MAQELQQVLAGLGLEGFRDVFDPHWEQSEATFPAGGPPFLQPQRFAEVRRYIELAPEADAALAQAALRVRQDPAFEHLAWHMHELLHRQRDYDAGQIRNAELHQLVREVDQLPDAEQQALILVIDSMVKRAKLHRIAGTSLRKRATSSARAPR